MGANLSVSVSSKKGGGQQRKPSPQLESRIQLLEDLCANDTSRRRELLAQLAGDDTGAAEEEQHASVLTSLPPQFNPGRLISAGSYGRVYAGTCGDQPAALKLLLLDEETAHAILNEVRLCLKLSHKNLVQLLDCAVVATNRHGGHPAPASSPCAAFTGHHQILPLFGNSPATPSRSCPYNYLPVVSGQGPLSTSLSPVLCQHGGSSTSPATEAAAAAGSRDAGGAPLSDLTHTDSRALAGLGHVCFEVWIAMELCDGGTLAEQLQHGFHCYPGTELVDMEQLLLVGLDVARALAYMHRENVCHGDLKADNVLLKTLSPSSTADMQLCPSCGSRSCCQEDCSSILMFLCNSPTSSYGGSSAPHYYGRSVSGDSCWSCYPSGCLEGGSSTPDTCSSASSNASGLHAERRSRSAHRGHLLSGLCCMGSPLSCTTADDAWDDDGGPVAPGCLFCGGGAHAAAELSPSADGRQQLHGYEPPAEAAAGLEMASEGQAAAGRDQDSDSFALPAAAAAAAPVGALSQPLHHTPFRTSLEGVPPVIVEGQEQVLQPLLFSSGEQHSSTVLEDVPEMEEPVAPLSLYTQRQRRRSRCLPAGVVLPAALAAAAAAAAGNSDVHLLSPASSGAGSSSSGSDDDAGAAHSKRRLSLEREHLPVCSAAPAAAAADLATMLPVSAAAAGPVCSQEPPASRLPFGWLDPVVAANLPPLGVPPSHDVYAHSMMLPPVPHRVRRHSYCYGTAASYGARVLSFNRPGLGSRIPSSSISATEAATAIAAAADAVRHDSTRAASVRKARRASWDDRMLRQHPSAPGALSGLLGAALPSFGRASVDLAAVQQPPAAATSGSSGRTRRHSWAGYLQRDAALAAAVEAGWGAAAAQQLHREQSLQPSRTASGMDGQEGVYGAALPAAAAAAAGSGSRAGSGRSGRMRRHSWAGHGFEQAGAKLPGFSVLSSCFAAADDVMEQGPEDAAGRASLQCSPQRHLLSLPPMAGWCGDSSWRTLDDTEHGADSSQQALLDGGPSSSMCVGPNSPECLLLPDCDEEAVGPIGCFGKWAPSCASSSAASSVPGIGRRRGQRRYSWCCGAGSEAEMWAVFNREDSNLQLGLLAASGAPLSVPLEPEQQQQWRRQRRDRRCSWDDFRYRNRLSHNWGRKASSMDAQVSTPSSWRSYQLDVLSSPATSNADEQLARSQSDAALSQHGGAAGPLFGEAAAALGSSRGRATPYKRHSASSLMQRASLPPSCDASPAAAAVADASARPGSSSAAMTPVRGGKSSAGVQLRMALPVPPVGSRTRHYSLDQPRQPSAAAQWSLQQQQQQLASTVQLSAGRPAAAAVGTIVEPAAAAAAVDLFAVLQQPQQARTSLLLYSSSASCVGQGGTPGQGSTRQVTVQDLLSLADRDLPAPTQQLGAAAAAGPPSAAAAAGDGAPTAATAAAAGASALPASNMVVKEGADHVGEELPPAPFTGSFPLQLPSSRAAQLSEAAAGSAAAASGGRHPSGKGRRWSTGVAAHQLLLRQLLLDAGGSDEADDQLPGAERVSTAGSQEAAPKPAAAGSAVRPPAAAAAAQVSEPEIVPAPAEPRPGSSSSQQHAPTLVSGPNALAAINVLGMPRQPPVVLSQRRMSYDTATGAYQLVAQMDAQQLQGLALNPAHPSGEQQWPRRPQQQQQHHVLPPPQQLVPAAPSLGAAGLGTAAVKPAAVTQMRVQDIPVPADSVHHTPTSSLDRQGDSDEDLLHDQQMQQQCQAQMQRLVEALAKKGYGGLMEHEPGSSSSQPDGATSAQAQPISSATLQHQASGSGQDRRHGSATLQQQQQVASDLVQPPRPRFCAKVCDFGFSKCLRAGQSHCSTASAGTITHQAPEVLRHGHLSPAADVYAFGIIMWELLTRDRPFRGLLEGDLVLGVCDRGLRPVFPPGCPASYVALAQQCWSDDPAQRPTAAQLVKRLHELLYEERRARLRASASSRHPTQVCRPRRHSMPVQGDMRHRRRSRRMSVFLLPFRQPPAVPEDTPLEGQLDTWPCTTSEQHVGTATWSGSHSRRSSEHRQQQLSGLWGARRAACVSNSSSRAVATQPLSSGSNVVVSTGGLLAGSSAPGRLRAASAAAGAVFGHASAPHIAPAAAAASGDASAGDGTEWFESF